ncbi:MAG: DUF6452 family protein [Bacteroidales bacterium]|jgi:hypothetical protein|nr:DUF6452 family protein [Bacteroidales bacterium]
MKTIHALLLFVVLLVVFACTDDECHLETDTLLQVEMSVSDPATPEHFIDSLSVFTTEWADSIHYSNEGNGNSLWLMLSPSRDTTSFIFTSGTVNGNDTLTLFYQREFILLSAECGFVSHFTINQISYTQNYIDSLKLEKNTITTDEQGLLKIYF